MDIKLVGDKILIREIKPEVSKTGFDAMGEQEVKRGEVLAVGNGRLCDNGTRAPMSVRVGNILLLPNLGMSFDVDGERLHVVREDDFIGIIINE